MLSKIKKARAFKFSRSSLWLMLTISVSVLTLLGLVILASAGQTFAHGNINLFQKQLISLLLAIVCGLAAIYIDLEKLVKYRWLIGGTGLLLLIMVLLPGIGVKVNGAKRWIDLGGLRFQASDIAKLTLIFTMSWYIAKNSKWMGEFKKGFLIPASVVGGACFLILLEPDFGTTFLCGCIGFGMMYMGGVRIRYLFPSLLGLVLLFGIAVMMSPVRLKRLTAFMDMEGNKLDGAYQLWQGILAFGAGGVTGVGLGNGRQQMAFLPEAHTDFIFPVIGEELGVFFTIGVVLCYLVFLLAGIGVFRRSNGTFFRLIVIGSLLCITVQALINLCVVTGLMPTKGMSLPFISYGGSNLILMFILYGFIVNSLRRWKGDPFDEEFKL